jgi:hypothetical protein
LQTGNLTIIGFPPPDRLNEEIFEFPPLFSPDIDMVIVSQQAWLEISV